ncbi:PCYCGC domain-containing protein [Paenibacillus tarimensis]|uniref:PCYCGC domain-containing protein n=1 Tax=Paenibacillus tarimensis TaxID=416012 RepID=UPI001F3EA5D5|nr:PCYCGC domain-containing protein [Paenibacillus tarimensis]MCF2942403.1 PCYCGC domain-containing protein [Paenibacillus tarimensis]
MKFSGISAALVLILLISACGGSNPSQPEQPSETAGHHAEHHQSHTAANGDLREATASADELPSFLNAKPEELVNVYRLAAEHSDLLDWIPCYCGCGSIAGHISSRNCFIYEASEDGAIVWDDHGTRCGTCLDIAFTAVMKQKEGLSIPEIRQYIDARYAESGEPTPTPEYSGV